MEYPKIALKGINNIILGKKIIKKLERLGGKNSYGFSGSDLTGYYFIHNSYLDHNIPEANIRCCKSLPKGYTLVQLEQKLFKLI